jgi:hypothetical protein
MPEMVHRKPPQLECVPILFDWNQDGFVEGRFLHRAIAPTAASHACLRAQRTADTPICPFAAIAGARSGTP